MAPPAVSGAMAASGSAAVIPALFGPSPKETTAHVHVLTEEMEAEISGF